MTVSQSSNQTIDGKQLKVSFTADFQGVPESDITSITATFYDASGFELLQYDVTDEESVTIPIEKDFSLQSVITYATATDEYESIANYALTRFAEYKLYQLADINAVNRTQRITKFLAETRIELDNAVNTHKKGERLKFDQDIADINRKLDYYLPC